MGNEFGSQFTLAMFVSYLLQWLKTKTWFPAVGFETEKVNQMLSIAIAFLSGLGIFFVFDKGAGTLTISGLTLPHIYHAGAKMLEQYALQHFTYRAAVAPPLPGVIQDKLRKKNGEEGNGNL